MLYGYIHLKNNGVCITKSYPYKAVAGNCNESTCTKSNYKP